MRDGVRDIHSSVTHTKGEKKTLFTKKLWKFHKRQGSSTKSYNMDNKYCV